MTRSCQDGEVARERGSFFDASIAGVRRLHSAKPLMRTDPPVDFTRVLEAVAVPAFLLDRQSRIRWLNCAAVALVGDGRRLPFARVVAPEDLHLARTQLARTLLGDDGASPYELTLRAAGGPRVRARISPAPLREGGGGEITGVFFLACPLGEAAPPDAGAQPEGAPALTGRQYETLALLSDGLGTPDIAERLGIAEETARNHIRALLRQLGVHSRLEAVVRGFRLGLLPPRRDQLGD